MTIERSDPKVAARERQWDKEVAKQLPDLLTRLLNSPIYGLGKDRDLPPAAYGVYLFSEKGKPRYVGRVGLTERSKRAGKKFSNFRTRLRGHVRPRHNEGTYAYARTVRIFHRNKLPLAGSRKANCADPISWRSSAVNASGSPAGISRWSKSPTTASPQSSRFTPRRSLVSAIRPSRSADDGRQARDDSEREA